MAKINQELLDRLAGTLGITHKAVYPRIQKVVAETMLERNLAALVLALRHGINITRYSTPQQRDEIRGVRANPTNNDRSPAPAVDVVPRRVGGRKARLAKKVKGNSVFVVHGRDEELRKSMFAFLRALGLNPMEWGHAVETARGANPYVGQILDSAMQKVQAVIVLFSPDELAQLKEQFCSRDEKKTEGKLQGQPRPNVLFEAGLALGAHPDKTLLVQVGKVRGFSDIAGKHLVRLSDDVGKRNEVASRLAKIGCAVNKIGNDWMTEGSFAPMDPKIRKTKVPVRSAKRSTHNSTLTPP
jgi:predicted nucleotide-binding protein